MARWYYTRRQVLRTQEDQLRALATQEWSCVHVEHKPFLLGEVPINTVESSCSQTTSNVHSLFGSTGSHLVIDSCPGNHQLHLWRSEGYRSTERELLFGLCTIHQPINPIASIVILPQSLLPVIFVSGGESCWEGLISHRELV
jgi:hypothetical protein